MSGAASARSKPLLLVESNVEDAFAFSRTLKASQLQCDFYMVASAEAAKRYLSAGSSDIACVPAVVVLSFGVGAAVVTELLEWISARQHLRGCVVLTLVDNTAPDVAGPVPGLRKPVSVEAMRSALAVPLDPNLANPLTPA